MRKTLYLLLAILSLQLTSCIEPPLKLPAQEVLVDVPTVITDIEVVWNLDVDWQHQWHYGWDAIDNQMWGPIAYPEPTNFEVRRHYYGEPKAAAPLSVEGFTIFGNRFRRSYKFGYYDLLLWSNIDSQDGTQVVKIDETNPLAVQASTTVTRGLTRGTGETKAVTKAVTALYNQPEVFYSTYPRDIYISRKMSDYDYYDEEEHCWVKSVNCELTPMVYIYLVQVILRNNDGRVVGTSGNAALSAFAASSDVNTGHTNDDPGIVYFNTRYKDKMVYEMQDVDIIGGKFTTFGLCDMASFVQAPNHQYSGSRTDLPNILMVDLTFSNGHEQTYKFDVTDQCRTQCHGGVITVVIDVNELEKPDDPVEEGTGSLFVPTVEDYDEIIYEIPLEY